MRFATGPAVKGWDELQRQAPANTTRAWQQMRTNPGGDRSRRHMPLKGTLGTVEIGGRPLPRWQYEVTAGGRVWYAIDVERRTVWVVFAGTGHPKATE
ncbi:hypothetical protein LY13_004529 [Prauserella aidingensis]|uniref:hypothetical protein n=1 Tax=Prauserella aidingensis TaxID=387890 RepID=UPI0020A5A8B8|nr:hypothetical protein [Prauserella aidingensis]MCP2255747.1 hypothetical protein [Prauserella aidingensis]